ncbi:MAG: hypothetical protein AAFN09_13590 [Pseudomonadota bacterium]
MFTINLPPDRAAFEAEFLADPEAPVRIEASTDNMFCEAAAERIARFADSPDVDDVRIIAMVRDPVARIVSEYEHTLRLGWQTHSLMGSLEAEAKRTEDNWHPLFRHIDRTRYASQIARYRALFGDRVITLDFHKIREAEQRTRLLEWIGREDESGAEEMEHRNKRRVVARPERAAILRNKKLTGLARSVVPKGLRPVVRKIVAGAPMERYEPSAEEIGFIRDALADELRACLDATDIPTEHWDLERLGLS